MAEFSGSALYIQFAGSTYQADFRTFGSTEEIGLLDASAGSDTNRTYLTTLKDGSGSLELVAQAGNTVIWPAFVPGTNGTLIWGEEGTAANKPKHQCNSVIVRSREKPVEYQGVVVYRFNLQLNAAVTDTIWS